MDRREALARRFRAVVALILVGMYIVGLALMLAGNVGAASALWIVSTVGGIALLYWIHTLNKRREDAEKASGDGESPSGGQ